MLIISSLSGIQEYLFKVREIGGNQARSLRFRSLFIQLLSEAIGIRLLHAAGLDDNHIIFSAAGKIAIDGAGLTTDRLNHVSEEARLIESWLRDKTHARLRSNIVIHDDPAQSMPEQYVAAGRALQESKLRGWSRVATSTDLWLSSALLADLPPDHDAEAQRDADIGRQVIHPDIRHVVFEKSDSHTQTNHDWDVAGMNAHFTRNPPGNDHHSRDLSRFARHVPREHDQVIEFVSLAKRSRGAPMLGVLKADADSLGSAIVERLRMADTLAPLCDLSKRLDNFFAHELDEQMKGDSRWRNLYTVFSGGDDILLVGPWDTAIDFAAHLQKEFISAFKDVGLTISAAVAIVKPKFPLHLAAQNAQRLLDRAKTEVSLRFTQPKDQLAALGDLWKWADHLTIVNAGKQLADWVDQDAVQHGWLHTLLQLTLLRRGPTPARSGKPHPATATAQLTYHVARNWKNQAARSWIDPVMREFDRYESTSHIETIHLPAIVRYAMLATRSGDSGEQP